jgi:hypothetical protein
MTRLNFIPLRIEQADLFGGRGGDWPGRISIRGQIADPRLPDGGCATRLLRVSHDSVNLPCRDCPARVVALCAWTAAEW